MDVLIAETQLGSTYHSLTDGSEDCYMESIDGIGELNYNLLKEVGPFQSGCTIRGVRYPARVISMNLLIRDAVSESDRDDARDKIMRLIAPTYGEVWLRFVLANSDVFYIQAISQGAAKGGQEWIQGVAHQRFSVQWQCPQPFFHPQTETQKTYTTIGSAESWTRYGNVIAYPNILLTGPMTNPVVTLMGMSGRRLDFTGYSIADADVWTIYNMTSNKRVVETPGDVNKLGCLSTASSFGTFYLSSTSPWNTSQSVSCQVDCTGTGGNTEWSCRYYDYQTHL